MLVMLIYTDLWEIFNLNLQQSHVSNDRPLQFAGIRKSHVYSFHEPAAMHSFASLLRSANS